MKKIALSLLLGIALPAFADRLPLPANTPASYKNECGSCHLPYPPALLAADDWRQIIGGLNKHFGSDAAVNPEIGLEIKTFLERNAGNASKLGSAGKPPRITQTASFTHKHREVPAKYWKDRRVKSAANCEACHRGAASGNFSEHDIALPELRE